jgi:hypothetical protein
MRRNAENRRLTVEGLSQDCLDVRDLCKMGALKDDWTTFLPRGSLRWPAIRKIRAARYLVRIELHDRTVPQQIRISWTPCHLGGWRPWMHCPYCEQRVAKLLKGMGGYMVLEADDKAASGMAATPAAWRHWKKRA